MSPSLRFQSRSGVSRSAVLFWLLVLGIAGVLLGQSIPAFYDRYRIELALDDVVPKITAETGDDEIKGLFGKALSRRQVGDFEPGLLLIRRNQGRVSLLYHTTTEVGVTVWGLGYPLDLTAGAQTAPLRAE